MLWQWARRLWDREPRPPLNLLAPDVVAEIVIYLSANGERRMFCSRFPPDTSIETYGHVANAIIQSGLDFGRAHGLDLRIETTEKRTSP